MNFHNLMRRLQSTKGHYRACHFGKWTINTHSCGSLRKEHVGLKVRLFQLLLVLQLRVSFLLGYS